MPRKKNVIAPEAQTMDLVAQDQKQQQLTAAKAFELYGFKDIQNYDLFVYQQKIGLFLQLADRSIIEAGKGLLVIKAQEKHGVFLKTLEGIGIAERTARRYMHIARRFGKTANLAVLPTSKLEALEELDDPTLEKLDAGEDVLGLTIKGIDAMPVSDVRKKAKELEAKLDSEKERHKKDVKELSAEIDTLRNRVAGQEPPSKEKTAAVSLEPLKKKLFEHVLSVQFYLDEAVKVVVQAQKVEGATFPQLKEWAMTHYEQLAPIGELFDELDKALVNCGPYNPESTGM
jgi:hypothetical protein